MGDANLKELELTLLAPPQQLLTGRCHELRAQLHNLADVPWLAICPTRFTGLLMQDGPQGQQANGGSWFALTARQFALDVDERVDLLGDVEARGHYNGANAPMLEPGPYALVVSLDVRLERPDGYARVVEVSCPAVQVQIVTRRPKQG